MLMLMFASVYNEGKATDWTGKIPPPCNFMQTDPNSNTSYGNWQGPFEYEFLTNTCPGCKIHVVYHQRIVTTNGAPPCVIYDTELNIAGIFYESITPGFTDCSLCSTSKSTLIAESIKKIYLMNSERVSFRDSIAPPNCGYNFWLRYAWTSTFCKGVGLCSEQICCARPIEYIFDGNSNDLIDARQRTNFPPITFPLQFVCPQPCTYDCDDVIFGDYNAVAFGCPIPCNYGIDEKEDYVTFPLFGYTSCPSCGPCFATAKYKIKKCGGYTDYSIVDISLAQSPACAAFMTSNPDWLMMAKQAAMERILIYKYGQDEIPNGHCKDLIREVSSSCWKMELTPQVHWVECVGKVRCCVSDWKICNVDGVYKYEKIITSNYITDCLNGCLMICGDYPRIIDKDKDDKGMINPLDNGKTILHFNKALQKNESFQLQIYNMNGIELSNTQYNVSEVMKYFAFKSTNLSNGNYYFLITQNNIILSKGILNVKE